MEVEPVQNPSNCMRCGGSLLQSFSLPFAMFSHLDFGDFPLPGGKNVLTECSDCGHLSRFFSDQDRVQIDELYHSKAYAEHQEEHRIQGASSGSEKADMSLAEAQASTLKKELGSRPQPLRVLDIGCFDGKLLVAIADQMPVSQAIGFDVDQRPGFPQRPGFQLVTGALEQVTGQFDLITFSQSIMYVPDLRALFEKIESLLAPQGALFVHVPNVQVRPAAVLLADQYHYFTADSLRALLNGFGFIATQLEETPFKRDLLFTARRGDRKAEKLAPALGLILRALTALAEQVRSFKPGASIYLFGSTIEAAFVQSLIADRVLGFVDENSARVGSKFHRKPVLHPSALKPADQCLVALGPVSKSLSERLSRDYPGEFSSL